MQENDFTTVAQPSVAEIPINSISKNALLESSKWGKWIAIANFTVALMLVLVTVQMIIGDPDSKLLEMESATLMFVAFISFLISVFIVPAVFFWLFSAKIKSSLTNQDPSTFADAIFQLKSLYKFYAIWVLVIIAGLLLLILVAKLGFL